MSNDFWAAIDGRIANQIAMQGVARHGIVSSVNPANGTVKVTYDESGTSSGWLPIAQQAVGAGWGMVTLPKPGTQVFVAPDMGSIDHGVVLGAVHSTQQPIGKVTPYKASSAVPLVPGEPTIISESGASLRFTSGGVIEMRGATVKIDGDLLVSGQVRDLDGVHGSLDVLRQAYNQHHHSDPQGGAVGVTDHQTP
jgi:phage gp45-like